MMFLSAICIGRWCTADRGRLFLAALAIPRHRRSHAGRSPRLPLFSYLSIEYGTHVRQRGQPGDMLEIVDGGSRAIFWKERGIEPARPDDPAESTPKAFGGPITRVFDRVVHHNIDLAPRALFIGDDQLGGRKGINPGNAALLESPFCSLGERHLPTIFGRPKLALSECSEPRDWLAYTINLRLR